MDASNVKVGVTGSVSYAPLGTTLPASLTEALDAGFVTVGYCSDDGLTVSEPEEFNKIKAWQGGEVVRRIKTEHEFTVKFKMIETSDETEELFYGSAAAVGTPIAVDGSALPHHAVVIDVDDVDDAGNTFRRRIVIPDGQVTERGDVLFSAAEAYGYEVTITGNSDASGNKAYLYKGQV